MLLASPVAETPQNQQPGTQQPGTQKSGTQDLTLAVPPVHPRRLAYLGTPEMAVAPLAALLDSGFDVPLVVTGEPKRRGRRGELSPTPVHRFAVDRGIGVSHRVLDVVDAGVDLGVVVAFGRLIRPRVLHRVPMVNLHFSLLPRWRGAAPVERALIEGDRATGVCVMAVDVGLDTGAVYASQSIDIADSDDADTLRASLVNVGSALLVTALTSGLSAPEQQRGEATYADKLTPADFEVRLDRTADALWRTSRVGPLWTEFRGKRFRLHRVEPAAGSGIPGTIDGDLMFLNRGALRMIEVQIEGKAAQPFDVWRNGAQPHQGERFGVGASSGATA